MSSTTAHTKSAFLSIGFRPFYLGAAIFAAIAIPLWAYAWLTGAPLALGYAGTGWHAHEMLFGFAPAVIAGFLLTATRAWTGLPTASGAALAALFALWVAGRAAPLFAGPEATAILDLAFLPTLAFALGLPLWRARNARNAFVVLILLLLSAANGVFHASALGWIAADLAARSVTVTLDLILLLMVVIGGRVIPAFSANAIPTLAPRTWPLVESLAIGGVATLAALDALGRVVPAAAYDGIVLAVFAAHCIRLWGWRPWRIRSNALLLILPISYAWIPAHLLLRALLDHEPGSLHPIAVHALVVGAMAGLMLSMMTRSARGHTGRPLRADRADIACFAFLHLAALTRVLLPLADPAQYRASLVLSAACWTIAFGTFAVAYAKRLTTPRPDAA